MLHVAALLFLFYSLDTPMPSQFRTKMLCYTTIESLRHAVRYVKCMFDIITWFREDHCTRKML
jgi:hypothetical protein